MSIKLGIAPINWCNDDDPNLGGHFSFDQIIKEMAEAGYIGTELGNKYPKNPTLLKETLDQYNLHLSSAWFSTYFTISDEYQNTLSRFMQHMSFMRALGAQFINVCECGHSIQGTSNPIFGSQKPVFSDQQWHALIQGLHTIGRIAHDYGVHIVYHYHAGTGVYNEGEIDFLMENTSPTLVSLLLDTGHAAFAGINPLHLIAKYKERIKYVHLKDIRMNVLADVQNNNLHFMDAVRSGVFTVPGDGSIAFEPIISSLRDSFYCGWMIVEAEQDPAKAPPLEYAQKAMNYLSGLIA